MTGPKETSTRQQLKNQRVRSYFVKATKEIILTEGVENVSIRRVAESAGYTFSTLYNYFEGLNELLQSAKQEMIQDLILHMQERMPKKVFDLDDLKEQNRQYIEYFVTNPNIFSFFYSYRLHPLSEPTTEAPDFNSQYMETYRGFVECGRIKESDVLILAKTIIYSLHGLLALYFSDNGLSTQMLYEESDRVAEFLLKGGETK